jgi:hypothetical protein
VVLGGSGHHYIARHIGAIKIMPFGLSQTGFDETLQAKLICDCVQGT